MNRKGGARGECSSETYVDTAAVISNLQELQASLLDEHFHRGRSSVDSILDQFLERLDRGHNDFAGCNLVYDICVQGLTSGHVNIDGQ